MTVTTQWWQLWSPWRLVSQKHKWHLADGISHRIDKGDMSDAEKDSKSLLDQYKAWDDGLMIIWAPQIMYFLRLKGKTPATAEVRLMQRCAVRIVNHTAVEYGNLEKEVSPRSITQIPDWTIVHGSANFTALLYSKLCFPPQCVLSNARQTRKV